MCDDLQFVNRNKVDCENDIILQRETKDLACENKNIPPGE